jgi:hypothetical protein
MEPAAFVDMKSIPGLHMGPRSSMLNAFMGWRGIITGYPTHRHVERYYAKNMQKDVRPVYEKEVV